VTNWPRVPLFAILREVADRDHPDLEVLSVYRDLGVVPKADRDDNFNKTPEDLSSYKRVRVGDVVINKMKAWSGSLAVSDYGGIVSGDYMVCSITGPIHPRFLHHLLRSKPVFSEIAARSTGIRPNQWRLYWDDLRQVRVALPPLAQQRVIADYLDAETARSDGIIERRQLHLDLLAEHRTELARASFEWTAGVVRLPWLPAIHADWPVIHLRWLITCLDGRRIPVNREERASMPGDIPYWGANGVVDHVDRALFHEPLVLLGEDGAPFFDRSKDKAFYVDEPIWVNNHIHVLRAEGLRPRYLAAYLNLVDYGDFIEGSTRDKLTQDRMGSIPVPVPPEAEQRRIEHEVTSHAHRFEALASGIRRQVDLLAERRQALVTAAVTGQIGIPGVAA
jgi:type I restriction enzyme S subunit